MWGYDSLISYEFCSLRLHGGQVNLVMEHFCRDAAEGIHAGVHRLKGPDSAGWLAEGAEQILVHHERFGSQT